MSTQTHAPQSRTTDDQLGVQPLDPGDVRSLVSRAAEQLDVLLQETLASADNTSMLRRELSEAQGQIHRVERENEGLKRMLAEMRDLCQTLTTRLKSHQEICLELETTKIKILQAERLSQEKMEAEYRANQRIKTLESNISTVQAQKDQLGRLNEQLMRQKLAVEEKLQETKTTTVAHGSQHQDIIFYKNKCIELQQENALLRQSCKTARSLPIQAERHTSAKESNSLSHARKHRRL